MITYLGSITVGGLIPGLASAQAAALAQLRGQLAGLVNVSAALTIKPPSLAASVVAAEKVALALSLAIDGPTVSLQITALAALIAGIEAQIAALLALPLDVGGLEIFTYVGPTQAIGGEVQAAIGGGLPGGSPLDQCQALIIATREAVAWEALGAVVRTS